jgi:L-alanine-DL-glutamate epimerase-like enolase superfamily enzyme
MAAIEALRADLYRVPLATELTDSTHGSMTDFELITVRVRDADGAEGLGYTYSVNAGGAAAHTMIERYFAPALAGREAAAIEHRWSDMWWLLHYGGRGGHVTSAISAVDIALWDLAGRRAAAPLWRLFGGYDPRVPVYAGGIDLQLPTTELLAQAEAFRQRGFRAIKMKVGRPDLREDVARVAAMRGHLGPEFPLMADANMRWTGDQAVRAATALAEHDLLWLEEPTRPEDLEGHARVVRTGMPVASGENLHTLDEFHRALTAGAITFPEPDVSNCGGYTAFRKICALAEAHHLPVTSHGVHDLTVHALAAAPNRTYMEVHGFGLDEFVVEPLSIEDGHTRAPERPGHGVALDFDRLDQHRA